jgi:hypothetical protein
MLIAFSSYFGYQIFKIGVIHLHFDCEEEETAAAAAGSSKHW